jgi:hypothetical protein
MRFSSSKKVTQQGFLLGELLVLLAFAGVLVVAIENSNVPQRAKDAVCMMRGC